MSMMAWSLSSKHHAQVRDHFLKLDKNHDGAISFDELWEAMSKTSKSEAEVWHIFDSLTYMSKTCGESEIRYSDFLAAMACTHFEPEEDLIRATFKKFDRRGAGFITAKDLRSMFGESFAGEDMETLIQEGGLNAGGKLNYQEFARYVQTSRTHLVAQRDACDPVLPERAALPPPKTEKSLVLLGRQGSQSVSCASPKRAHQVVEVPMTKADQACCAVQ